MPATLILASASQYRRELLGRLRIPFTVDAADVAESRAPGETPLELVTRLAREKALRIAGRHPGAWVIGADQIALCGGHVLGKPGTAVQCIEQLRLASAQTVTFLTAACLTGGVDPRCVEHVDETRVRFRVLSDAEIARYVDLERPFDCAGGFKSEGLGIALMEQIDSHDPTALIGLPLIWLAGALRRAGLSVL
jgi:septum formation protein